MEFPGYLRRQNDIVVIDDNEVTNTAAATFVKQTLTITKDIKNMRILIGDLTAMDRIRIVVNEGVHVGMHVYFLTKRQNDLTIAFDLKQDSRVTGSFALYSINKMKNTLIRDVTLAENARMEMQTGIFIHGCLTIDETVALNGENAQVALGLLNVADDADHIRMHQIVRHLAPHTTSDIDNRLVASESSRLDYVIKGLIKKGMYQSACHQSSRGLLLSEDGEIAADPQLLIDEYDVDASHGLAVGQIDEDQLFYLKSRGIDDAEAKRLIVMGYVRPFITALDDESIENRIKKRILFKIKGVAS